MVYSKGGHSMRNRVNRLMKFVSLKMKRDEGPAPGSTWIFFLGFAPSSILAAANYSRCHNWRIIALKSKGWSQEELNRHSKATQFFVMLDTPSRFLLNKLGSFLIFWKIGFLV